MRIYQIVSNLSYGDAIGNDVIAIHHALLCADYKTEIMAISVHEKLKVLGKPVDFTKITSDDLVLFHKASGDAFLKDMIKLESKKVLIYHNITPAKYFLAYDEIVALNQLRGRRQLAKCATAIDYAWADSSYNREELIRYRFPKERTAVLPILMDLSQPKHLQKMTAPKKIGTKLLFIGRVAPNKKHEDLIKAYYVYREYDPDAKLILVGSWNGNEKYYAKLKGFAADLGLSDDQVIFTGHVTDEEKERYLSEADCFLCMSEHEGFCVPVLEAMSWNLPVIAYRASAVPETIGEQGLIFDHKDYGKVAELIYRSCRDKVFREKALKLQQENLKRFDHNRVEGILLDLVNKALEGALYE